MQLYGALVLLVTLSAACGLRCYTCTSTSAGSCTQTSTCPDILNRCFSLNVGVVTKGCQNSVLCVGPIKCCEGDLCNSAMPTASSVLLLLVSSAITTLFL
ncbi:lymphocyte antigen 6G-like [Micropterus salmoides]|uniref:lymphocyte antigen 6G-like n=1 Tax=Micropterus salmoides TaxID=27706 RepID=UPI0018ED7B4B|nr:lymphocyte antigen 6G-like [Micropterus salmoides]XP_038558411.1 lymphocyte antigen 6G-like [Micropterus salmoides]